LRALYRVPRATSAAAASSSTLNPRTSMASHRDAGLKLPRAPFQMNARSGAVDPSLPRRLAGAPPRCHGRDRTALRRHRLRPPHAAGAEPAMGARGSPRPPPCRASECGTDSPPWSPSTPSSAPTGTTGTAVAGIAVVALGPRAAAHAPPMLWRFTAEPVAGYREGDRGHHEVHGSSSPGDAGRVIRPMSTPLLPFRTPFFGCQMGLNLGWSTGPTSPPMRSARRRSSPWSLRR
jgi:hypothetical protein